MAQPKMKILTTVDGYGQKATSLVVYDPKNLPSNLSAKNFTVEAQLTDVRGAVTTAQRSIANVSCLTDQLIIELDPRDEHAPTFYYDEEVRLNRRLQVAYKVTLQAPDGAATFTSTDRLNLVVDDFQPHTYRSSTGAVVPYQLFVPKAYDATATYPVIMFLHGAGERGTDGFLPLEGSEGAIIWARDEEQRQRPCFVIAPQCPPESSWTERLDSGKYLGRPSRELQAAYEILQNVMAQYNIDTQRVYVTGLSMGGFGTWALGMAHPESIAALVPICGGGNPKQAAALASTPIWAFHHAGDRVVPVDGTRRIVEELERPNEDLYYRPVLYTEYQLGDGLSPNDHFSWVPAYQTEAMRQWLFAQRLGAGVPKVRNISPKRPLPDPPFEDGKIPYGFAKTDHIQSKYCGIRYTNQPDSPQLDVYLPDQSPQPYPVIMYVHGGAFFFGSKEMDDLQPILSGLERGYAVVSINYTLMDCPIGLDDVEQSVFPKALYQAKAAVRWIRANAGVYGFDPERIAVLGTSAGGQIAGLLGTTGHKPETEVLSLGNSTYSSAVQAAIIACGANVKVPENLCSAFSTGIADHVVPAGPPLLLLHGREDESLPYEGSVALTAALRQVLGRENVKLVILPEAGHNNDPAFFDNPHVDTKKEIFDFTDQVFNIATGDDQYSAEQLEPGLWRILDCHRDCMYLVEGQDKALLINTGMGNGDLKGYLQRLTKKPLEVFLTHGHPDHILQADQFDRVYLSQEDCHLAATFAPDLAVSSFKDVKEGDVFSLGGRSLEVIGLPGHTPGSLALLDRGNGLLFSGDAIGSEIVWMQLPGCSTLTAYLQTLNKLRALDDQYDTIYAGHVPDQGPALPAQYLQDMIALVKQVVSGSVTGTPYSEAKFGGLEVRHGTAAMAYDPQNIGKDD